MILKGTVILTRALLEHTIWEQDLAVRAGAVDLLLRANNRTVDVQLNGQNIHLERGQLAYSKTRLAREWGCSEEKLDGILRFLELKAEFIRVEKCGPRGTIITVINYERYNPTQPDTEPVTEPGAVSDTEPVTEPGAVSDTEPVTRPGQKVEYGIRIGNKKGEEPTPYERPAAEIPSDETIREFCANYQDLARGISGIPEVWWAGWIASRISSGKFPINWERVLTLAFRSDFLARHPKAISNSEKNREKKGGKTAAQQSFLIDRELREVQQRLNAAYETGVDADPEDINRERQLQTLAAEAGEVVGV